VSVALYTGSFDPVHLGHLAIIEEAASMFDRVVVAVLANPEKASGLLPVDERVRLVLAVTDALPNVDCIAHHGLAIDAARLHGATTLVRSAHKEQRNELTMAAMNATAGGVPTAFVTGDPALGWISSSVVRASLAHGDVERVRAMVPGVVADALLS
jgi:pantetheine-phosphate adenylyltransferase